MEIPVNSFTRTHLSNGKLMQGFTARVAQDRSTTAELLADMAEIEKRRLYVPAGYSSMYAYCLSEQHMSGDVAYKRIQAARAARRFPAILDAVAGGRLHLTAIVLLAPHLTRATADELFTAAAHKSKAQIKLLLAERFPNRDVPASVQPIVPAPVTPPGSAEPRAGSKQSQLVPEPVGPSVGPAQRVPRPPLPTPVVFHGPPFPTVEPIARQRFAVQFTFGQSAHDKLRHAQALLGHALPSGDIAEVLERALDVLIEKLEKQKFAATGKPRPQKVPANGRHIPASVKRAVWERDQGRCTFVGEQGKRCESRTRIEFDHVEAVGRGGQATVRGVRLLCHAHNQYAAERVFGPAFMDGKREQGQERAAKARARVEAEATRALPQPSALSCIQPVAIVPG
jgi:hypothetical protein